MEITYQHANPKTGNESFLIRVRNETGAATPCILVDAGDDVDVDPLLGDDEYLAAILLTHAHVDHYRSLDTAHRDGAPILTSPGTAAMFEDVLAEGARHHGLRNTETILDHVTGIEDWFELEAGTIRIHPVPAGHTPGACGFLLRFRDDDESFRALVTGDFTRRDVAGYPGFDSAAYVGIDALFLTAATADGYEHELADVLATLVHRANAGSTTLCTTGGLTGIHLAALIAAVNDQLDYSVPIRLVGQAAKLYDALAYEFPNVSSTPTFSDPASCLSVGTVTIAGPEVPIEGSSKRLFESIQDDPNAVLVQVGTSGIPPFDSSDARGTVTSARLSNHPSESVLNEIVEAIAPSHVIVVHQHEGSAEKYRDEWDAYTWATGNANEQTLFDCGSITAPPWVGQTVRNQVRNRDGAPSLLATDTSLVEAISPPTLGRRDYLDLDAEGIDVDYLQGQLTTGLMTEELASFKSDAGSAEEVETDGPVGGVAAADGELIRTVGPDPVTAVNLLVRSDDEATAPGGLFETVPPPNGGSIRDSRTDDGDDEPDDDRSESSEADDANSDAATVTDDESPGVDEPADESEQASTPDTDLDTGGGVETEGATSIEIDPAVRAVLVQQAAETETTIDDLVVTAVEEFLEAVLRGEVSAEVCDAGTETPRVAVETTGVLDALLEDGAQDAGLDAQEFVTRTIYSAVDVDPDERALSVVGLDTYSPMLDALTDNDAYPFETVDAAVEAALERTVVQ